MDHREPATTEHCEQQVIASTPAERGRTAPARDTRLQIRYFTVGNGNPAPGGFVPMGAATVQTLTGWTATEVRNNIQVVGLAGVPSTASAIYANLTIDNTGAGQPDGWLKAYAASGTAPATSLNFDAASKSSIGTTIDLDAQGKFSITMGPAAPVSVRVDVMGYFDGQVSNAGFTPIGTRIYDSNVSPNVNIAAGTTVDVPVTGVAGMPAYSASISGIAMNVQTAGSTAAGGVIIWPYDASMPTVSTVEHGANSQQSNLAIIRPGTNGKVKIKNTSASGSIRVVLDAQGYFTNVNSLPPATGLNTGLSGNRAGTQMLTQPLTDRISAGINPVNGNLLLTQNLLSLTGVGVPLSIGVRYNSLNDNRPTLNVGLYEAQLFRNADNTVTYTAPDGGGYIFTPSGPPSGGVTAFTMPYGINAHLKLYVVSGQPDRYELVLHPEQTKMIFRDSGANVRLDEIQDVTGSNKISFNYGAGPQLLSITDSQGRVVNLGYSSSPNPTQPTTITDTSISRTITLAYAGPGGALSTVTDATGSVTTWAYDAQNRVKSITDGRTNRTAFFYNTTTGKLTLLAVGEKDSTKSGSWDLTYTSATSTTVDDPRGKDWVYSFPTAGQVTSVLNPYSQASSATWYAHGEQESATSAEGDVTSYEIPQPSTTYNLTKITSPSAGGGGTGLAGRTMQASFPVPTGSNLDYRPTSLTDEQGALQKFTLYNSWGQAVTVERGKVGMASPAGGTWTYKFQGSDQIPGSCGGKPGQLCQIIDGKTNTTTFAYDAAGNLTSVTPPTGLGAHTYTYDAAGRKITEVDGKGNTQYTCYDGNDRVTQVSYTSSNCAVQSGVTYTYDAAGNMATQVSAAGTTTYTFDLRNRITAKTHSTGSGVYDSAATYDRSDNVLTIVNGGTTGADKTTTYRYDDANRLVALALPGGSCPATPLTPTTPNATDCVGFVVDGAGRRTETRFPNGTTTYTAYDGSSRPLSITTKDITVAPITTLVTRAYTYATSSGTVKDTGLVQTISDGSITTTYGYDGMNRLLSATPSTGTATSWLYDFNGNRTKQTTGATVTNYGYNAADQLCWSGTGTSATCTPPGGATSYTYDGQGNQTSGGNTYNTFDQLTATTTGGALSHTYAGTTNNQRFTSTGTSFTNNAFNQLTQEKTSTSTTKYIRDPGGTLIAMQHNTSGPVSSYYYTLDNVGSVIQITDASKAIAASYTYDTFGNTLTATGGMASTNHYRYATGYTDPTGLTKLGARYYNPTLGRFTQTDPSHQETNLYLYAGANPTTYNDPSGLCGDEFYSLEDCDLYDPTISDVWDGAVTGAAQGGTAGAIIGCGIGAALGGATCLPVAGFYGTAGLLWGALAGASAAAWGE